MDMGENGADKRSEVSTISYSGCAAQLFLYVFFIGTEFSLLTVMCYDRYVSICKPLHYGTMVFSYVQIFRAVLGIPSEQGRHKAFSTCLSHLTVVSLFCPFCT
ncbi:olfactory receptor 10A4-like [Melospiza melodia melodia]|uniref:olfactory receptor 10A4-like n=1 Tax=Melospiza melodia melodia TaxID=1914991 RepID=UPI002FD04878